MIDAKKSIVGQFTSISSTTVLFTYTKPLLDELYAENKTKILNFYIYDLVDRSLGNIGYMFKVKNARCYNNRLLIGAYRDSSEFKPIKYKKGSKINIYSSRFNTLILPKVINNPLIIQDD